MIEVFESIMRLLRPEGRARNELAAVAIALLVSLAVGSVLIRIAGASPAVVWWAMVERTFGDSSQLGLVFYKATGLVFCGLAVSLALDAGLFNIGGEAQLAAGVLVCAIVGGALPAGTPAIIGIPLALIAAAAGGAAIGYVIGFMRARRNAHEVITAIMLNAIVAGVVLWIGNEFLFHGETTESAPIVAGAELPSLEIGGSPANTSIVLALLAVAAMWWLRSATTWGRAWRAVGEEPAAARSVGISVERMQILAMTGSGALAGLAAANFVMGHKHAFEDGLGRGTGFLGISAALLGRSHPAGIVLAALLLGFLSAGGLAVQDQVPKEVTEVLQGIVVLAVAASAAWVQRRSERR